VPATSELLLDTLIDRGETGRTMKRDDSDVDQTVDSQSFGFTVLGEPLLLMPTASLSRNRGYISVVPTQWPAIHWRDPRRVRELRYLVHD